MESITSAAGYYTEVDDVDYHNVGIRTAGPSTLAVVLLFGTVIFATVGLGAKAFLISDYRAFRAATRKDLHPRPLDITSFTSVYTLLHHLSGLSLLLLLIYIFEHHPPFPHEDRDQEGAFDADFMALLLAIVVALCFKSVVRNDGKTGSSGSSSGGLEAAPLTDPSDGLATQSRTGKSSSLSPSGGDMDQERSSGNEAGGATADDGTNGWKLDEVSLGDSSGEFDPVLSSRAAAAGAPSSGGNPSAGGGSSVGGRGEWGQFVSGAGNDGGSVVHDRKKSPSRVQRHHDAQGNGHGTTDNHIANNEGNSTTQPLPHVLPDNDILNRPQTYEWRGWMILLYLLSQYTHASSVNEWHNSLQTCRSAFLWMSSFGHFTYFYTTKDYSLQRVVSQLWRVNFLVALLCMSQGTPYILYFICPLHSFFFLWVYFAMKAWRTVNYTKYALRVKLLMVAMVVYLLWDVNLGLFRLVHLPFVTVGPSEDGAPLGPMWEWYFQTSMHHWNAFLGIVFAVNYPVVSVFTRRLEASTVSKQSTAAGGAETPLMNVKVSNVRVVMAKALIACAFLSALYMWSSGPLHYNRYTYNDTHGYFSFIPILAYVYIRNLTPTMRQHSVSFLRYLGSMALELYLVHHHLFLSSKGKTMLILVPGSPKCNMIAVALLFFFVARKLHKLTFFLRTMLLFPEEKKCVQSIGVMVGVMVGFYCVALTLDRLNVNTPGTLAALVMICGMLLYQTTLDATWKNYRRSGNNGGSSASSSGGSTRGNNAAEEEENAIAKSCPPLIATMVIILLGLAWQGVALMGAGQMGPLPSTCDALANDGKWTTLDACSSYEHGLAARQFDISSFGHCQRSYAWGWKRFPPNMHCRFSHRSSAAVQAALQYRSVLFMGDGATRNLYHAVCRLLQGGADNPEDQESSENSMIDEGSSAMAASTYRAAYDASIRKHSDMAEHFGNTFMEYKWAPLAIDEFNKLRQLRNLRRGQGPDVIVIGGGVWDRLHLWATDEDTSSHREVVMKLVEEMKRLKTEVGIPIVWMIPTTIHTKALNSDEKRFHMNEQLTEEMRRFYAELGIPSAASFVLDGTAFTKDIYKESYDGVHYPPYVYDVGAQILMNALDWLLPDKYDPTENGEPFDPPAPGAMANPFLGLMMLCFCVIGFFFFDGYLGFSYLGSAFSNTAMPSDLYEEAFTIVHRKYKLPRISNDGTSVEEEVLGLLSGGSGSGSSEGGTLGSGKDSQERMDLHSR